MELLLIPAVILIGVPILYLLLQLYWRLNPKHRPRRRRADQELRQRERHGGWFYPGGGGGATSAAGAAALADRPMVVGRLGRTMTADWSRACRRQPPCGPGPPGAPTSSDHEPCRPPGRCAERGRRGGLSMPASRSACPCW